MYACKYIKTIIRPYLVIGEIMAVAYQDNSEFLAESHKTCRRDKTHELCIVAQPWVFY